MDIRTKCKAQGEGLMHPPSASPCPNPMTSSNAWQTKPAALLLITKQQLVLATTKTGLCGVEVPLMSKHSHIHDSGC